MNKIFRKAAAVIASCAVMITALNIGSPVSTDTVSAANKARVSVHDPSVVKDGNTYYVFGSHIEAAKTTDLQNWTRFSNGYERTNNVEFGNLSQNLKKAFDWCGEDLEDCAGGFAVWAPDVVYDKDFQCPDGSKGAYLMYFCTSSTYIRSLISFAWSKKIDGVYTFGDTLIYSGFTNNDQYVTSSTKRVNKKYTSTNVDELIASGEVTMNNSWFSGNDFNKSLFPNAIDPTIYYDTSGRMYMTYGSWSGGIFTIEINAQTGKCIHPKTGTTSDGRMVDSYFGTKIAGGYGKSGEGPFIEYNPDTGYYYLWTTYGGLTAKGGYNMRVSRSTSPLGPFTDAAGRSAVFSSSTNLNNIGLKVMGNYKFSTLDTAYMAPGHNSVLHDDDGRWYLFYHTRFNSGTEYHEVRVHEMFFSEDGWPVVTPFEYGGSHISASGYDEADIAGDYEYINHGNATDGNVINYQNIKLNADHTISGAVTGRWEQSPDSSEATLTIGGQRYSGHFIAAENEKGTKVMSFTAVGNNNQTVWGAKSTLYTGSKRTSIGDYTNPDAKFAEAPDTAGERSKAMTVSGTGLLSGTTYFITNKNSGLSLDLPNGKLDAGTNIQQWDFNKGFAQQWRLIAVDDEYFRIAALGDETKCVAVASDTSNDGTNVELQTYTGANNQLFKLVKCGTYYGILSKCSNGAGALDVFEWSKENGGNVNQYAYHEYDCQVWKIEPVRPSMIEGNFVIKNMGSGKYLTEENSAAVQGDKRKLILGKNTDGTFSVKIVSGKALTVENSSAENGANILFSEYTGDTSQKFSIRCNKDGSYSLMTVSSDGKSCIDVYEASKESGAKLCQWEYKGSDNQKFAFELVPETEVIPEPEPPAEPTTEPVTEPPTEPQKVIGDVNADGAFDINDIIMMRDFLLGKGVLTDTQAGDVCTDGTFNVYDLIAMKRMLIKK